MNDRARRARESVRGLYPVLDVAGPGDGADVRVVLARARAVAVPGVRVIQLRAKALPDRLFHEIAASLAAVCRGLSIALVVNDRADIAAAVGAAGVHLGTDDLPLSAARRMLPPGMFVGRSTDSPEEAREAMEAGADYIAWGACFPSATKPDAAPQEGPSALARVRAAIPGVPLVAIGGITADRLATVAATGCDAFAVIGALRDAADPGAQALRLVSAWDEARSLRNEKS
jgi:thiamine-phosphate pyrophosphorylase